ncbi:MAG: GTP-binding protein, partial [SAR324 cluster bacterium]|nr:GTP-binding protein [SAR324 cluster bacterium]
RSILQNQTFKDWVDRLPDSVIRGKGVLHLKNKSLESFIWQKVGKNYSLTKSSTPLNNEGSELLLIGNPEMPSLEIIGIPTGYYKV